MCGGLLLAAAQRDGEVARRVRPGLDQPESVVLELAAQTLRVELDADLGAQLGTGREIPDEVDRTQNSVDVALRTQPHLDSAPALVPSCDVIERCWIEAGAVQLSTQDLDQVAVEGGGDAAAVVVGSDEALGILGEICAEQEVVARRHRRADPAEERRPLVVVEVADRPAEERDQATP